MSSPLAIASLEQLDALVGRYVMDDAPEVYWEHTCSHWRFDSLSDALSALDDPFYAELVPGAERSALAVTEVREFPPYSADLQNAIRLVEQLGHEEKALTLVPKGSRWSASFGGDSSAEAPSAPVAICMAALCTRGLEVRLTRDFRPDVLRCA